MTAAERAMAEFQAWFDDLPRPKSGAGGPPKGSIAVGLVLLERLKTDFRLELGSHLAPGGAQIQGASGVAVAAILAAFGESRRFVGEGGRTNRGTPAIAAGLLRHLEAAKLDDLSTEDRVAVLTQLQAFLVDKVRAFHNLQRLKPTYDPSMSTRQFISDFLLLAKQTGKWGPVAQYLVGAKLELRYPDNEIRNQLSSAADDQSGQPGDFLVADTAFHVTVAPSPGHYEKCRRNLREGRRAFILVPDQSVVGVRQNAEAVEPGRIAVESIESFVGQNIEELSGFSQRHLAGELRKLLMIYNERVDAVEIDKSMLVEIPRNLAE